ncbi:MAG: hypothetical protein GXY38_07225 [Planctomycetes bacterium]|jgi:Zn finger protein HypA/HybF involved in hydrogenase expression|nr:hypothetical protein [Planctomycetota bacterium]
MDADAIADQIVPQLLAIAEARGLRRVNCVEMIVGVLYGVSQDTLVESLRRNFSSGPFVSAEVRVSVVSPGNEFVPPNSDSTVPATGWEMLILKLDGEE